MAVEPILYCGDPHGQFGHIIGAAVATVATAIVLLGDMQPERPLDIELAPLLDRGMPVWWIPGNQCRIDRTNRSSHDPIDALGTFLQNFINTTLIGAEGPPTLHDQYRLYAC